MTIDEFLGEGFKFTEDAGHIRRTH